jgi:hypothetical protein
MDAHRFDALTKALATPGSRRRLFGVLAALPLIGAVTEHLTGEVAAGERPASTATR